MASVPERETEVPKKSFVAPLLAVSSACWVQVVPDCANTYAAPSSGFAPTEWLGDPTTVRVPEIDTQ